MQVCVPDQMSLVGLLGMCLILSSFRLRLGESGVFGIVVSITINYDGARFAELLNLPRMKYLLNALLAIATRPDILAFLLVKRRHLRPPFVSVADTVAHPQYIVKGFSNQF